MFNNRVFAVLKRELRERIMTKSFIISTLALPLIMVLIFGFQFLMLSMEGDKGTKLFLVSEVEEVTEELKRTFAKISWVKDDDFTFTYATMRENEFETYISEHKSDILEGRINGMVFVIMYGTLIIMKKEIIHIILR